MTKIKKITVDQLRAHCKPVQTTTMWHGIAVTVRTVLPMQEITSFVNSVMDGCYDSTHDIMVPEMMDFAFRLNVVMRYACVDLPEDIAEQYELLYNTDLYDCIVAVVNSAQVEFIRNTISNLLFKAK